MLFHRGAFCLSKAALIGCTHCPTGCIRPLWIWAASPCIEGGAWVAFRQSFDSVPRSGLFRDFQLPEKSIYPTAPFMVWGMVTLNQHCQNSARDPKAHPGVMLLLGGRVVDHQWPPSSFAFLLVQQQQRSAVWQEGWFGHWKEKQQ